MRINPYVHTNYSESTMNPMALKSGMVVKHFKRETVTKEEKEKYFYLYKIEGLAKHTETGQLLVIYTALYDDPTKNITEETGKTFARDYEMFMSEVDKVKYPDIKQKYRFEEYEYDL